MRKFYLILFLSFSVLGATNFFINGDSVATITVDDILLIVVNVEGGDTLVHVTLYYDRENNGIVDAGEPVVDYFCVIDGSWEDIDETVNGYISIVAEFLPFVGDFIFVAEDGVRSDQVILHVESPASSLSLSGQITPDTAGAIVGIIPLPTSMLDGDPTILLTVTDTNGDYSVGIPDSFAGTYFTIITATHNDVLPDYVGVRTEDSVLLTGNDTLDGSLIQTDGALITGYFRDENGFAYTQPIGSDIRGGFANMLGIHFCSKLGFTTGGTGSMLLHTSPFGQVGNNWMVQISQNYSPYHMCPEFGDTIHFSYPPDTLSDSITVFSCDAEIAGTVFVDGSPSDGEGVWAWSDSTGSAPDNGSYSTGYYKILVSSQADSYYVGLSNYDWTMYGGDKVVVPGSTGVNFYVNTGGIEEEKENSILKASPGIITATTVLEISGVNNKNAELKIYDVTGKLVKTLPQKSLIGTTASYKLDTENLPTGIFFGKIESQKGTFKLSVIK